MGCDWYSCKSIVVQGFGYQVTNTKNIIQDLEDLKKKYKEMLIIGSIKKDYSDWELKCHFDEEKFITVENYCCSSSSLGIDSVIIFYDPENSIYVKNEIDIPGPYEIRKEDLYFRVKPNFTIKDIVYNESLKFIGSGLYLINGTDSFIQLITKQEQDTLNEIKDFLNFNPLNF